MGRIALFESRLARMHMTVFAAAAVTAFWSAQSYGGPQEDARAAYARGTKAFEDRDYETALEAFSAADETQPNPFALESAIKSAILAEDAVAAMELSARAEGRAAHPGVTEQVKLARDKFGHQVGRMTLHCPVETPCTLTRDGQDVEPAKGQWLRPGSYQVEVRTDGHTSSHVVEIRGGGELEWHAPAVADASPPPIVPLAPEAKPDTGGLSPAFFVVGASLTAVAAGIAVGSGVQAVGLNDDFKNNDDSAEGPGRDAQTRANVLWAATGVLGTTSVVFLLLTDWSGENDPQTGAAPRRSVDVRVGLASASLVGAF